MTTVKQRRSFFVDDILHMVMPMTKHTNYRKETNEHKRKRSSVAEDNDQDEDDNIENDLLSKKIRSSKDDEKHQRERDGDIYLESKHSRIVDGVEEDGTAEESSTSDNSNSVGLYSGKLTYTCIYIYIYIYLIKVINQNEFKILSTILMCLYVTDVDKCKNLSRLGQ